MQAVIRKTLMDREHERAKRVRLLEVIVIVAVLTVLFSDATTQMIRYLDRARLVNVFSDASGKRTYIAERLSLTGELPDSMHQGVEYRFEHSASLAGEVEAVMLQTGFGAAQKAIEERLISKTNLADKATPQTGLATESETLVSSQQYFASRSGELQTSFGSRFTEGEDFFVSGGSFYYLVDKLGSTPEEEARIMSFVVNSPVRHKASTIWYSCGPSTATSLGSAATSASIDRIEIHCR